MKEYQAQSPVVLMVYNRPEKTALVFKEIARAKPRRLFVIADGPKPNGDDERKCAETRRVVERVDWECDVVAHFSEANLGCRRRISSGLDAVFQDADRAIILEDDCLPSPAFFSYCDELLDWYQDDDRVGHVNGYNPRGSTPGEGYYFSRYPHVWGWATWRRAWSRYDASMTEWKTMADERFLKDFCDTARGVSFWRKKFDAVANEGFDTWDYQWVFALWRSNLLSITPSRNLVRNIGFDHEATHTKSMSSTYDPTVWDDFKLAGHPPVRRDSRADSRVEALNYVEPTLRGRIWAKLKRLGRVAGRG